MKRYQDVTNGFGPKPIRESLFSRIGTWATFAVAAWCVFVGGYYLVDWVCGGRG